MYIESVYEFITAQTSVLRDTIFIHNIVSADIEAITLA